MNWKEFLTGYKGKNIPKELNEFNWGAFLLTFIWGIKHKAWITLLAIPLIYFQSFDYILLLKINTLSFPSSKPPKRIYYCFNLCRPVPLRNPKRKV